MEDREKEKVKHLTEGKIANNESKTSYLEAY